MRHERQFKPQRILPNGRTLASLYTQESVNVLVSVINGAELLQTTSQNITLHIKAIYAERELLAEATCKEHLQVREEGKRQVKRALMHHT